MATTPMLWRTNLVPASFKGAGFKVDVAQQQGGRRIVEHEFPMRDIPWAEDLARRARRFTVTGYIVQGPREPNYQATRDALIAQLESLGSGSLVHPTMGTNTVVCDTYTITESREKGGIAEFEMVFREAGTTLTAVVTPDTSAVAAAAAVAAGAAIVSAPPPAPASGSGSTAVPAPPPGATPPLAGP